ncbi:lactonase family protein [Flavobacterium agrisoli]|uniref:Lactonase family protein n=1 Tax=Flavobacterium agrisoli TaxID=2793066 RepID=A0A934PP16_9FLAO|nr:lactonase family protein [Flavobacterium agrisoli]MBK0370011.1 lactonase family protein [Flavobacterium agrisoli]
MKKMTILAVMLSIWSLKAQKNKLNLLIGTYTTSCESSGIYNYLFDTETGELSFKSESEKVINPSYLAVSEDHKRVYSVNKRIYSVNEGGMESYISAFDYDVKTGKFKFLNKQNSGGANPCYIITDDENVITANYTGGSLAVFKKTATGISETKQVLQHVGKGSNPERQEAPHVHMVYFSPDKKYVLSNDLGLDKIFIYEYHPKAEKEILTLKKEVSVKAGSGPRHLMFGKNGKNVYLLNELNGSLFVFDYQNGELQLIQETTVVSPDFKGEVSAADIHISPDGKFLYATNRGEANDVTAFKIENNGKLQFVQRVSTGGKGPRNFTIDPTGNFLLVGHQYTNDIVLFERDKKSGKLKQRDKKTPLCSPVCLVFLNE